MDVDEAPEKRVLAHTQLVKNGKVLMPLTEASSRQLNRRRAVGIRLFRVRKSLSVKVNQDVMWA